MKSKARANSVLIMILLCSFTILFFSCSKDKNDNKFHISFKVDGVLKEFNALTFAQFDDQAGPHTALSISGVPKADGSEGGIAIDISPAFNTTPVAVDEHTFTDTSTNHELFVTYIPPTRQSYQAGQNLIFFAGMDGITIANHFSITISEITNKSISGHFSGDFFLNGDPRDQKVTITDGDFNVALQ